MNKSSVKYCLRHAPLISKYYRKMVDKIKGNKFDVKSLKHFSMSFIKDDRKRINLVLPAFESDFVYGGISTAIKLFLQISEELDIEKRIIVMNGSYSKTSSYKIEGFTPKGKEPTLLFLNDVDKIDVGINDFFVATIWSTANAVKKALDTQIDYFGLKNRCFVYLIQDYEPGFYKWSSEFLLADNTYTIDSNRIIALFNSRELERYFAKRNYSFGKSYSFSPKINDRLYEIMKESECVKKRKKIIIIYGRPRVERNAFEIIVDALNKWANEYEESNKWKIISLGAKYDDIQLDNGQYIRCLGKVSIDEYASIMKKAYAGISLMISPHPSYPPLEFSTFGVRTITNKFENKNLQNFNKNIISLDNCTSDCISGKLKIICKECESYNSEFGENREYLDGTSFIEAVHNIEQYIQQMYV